MKRTAATSRYGLAAERKVEVPARPAAIINGRIGRQQLDAASTLPIAARLSLPFRGHLSSPFLGSRSGKYALKWEVPFVTCRLVKSLVGPPQTNLGSPRASPHARVLHRNLIADFIRRNAGEALD